MDITNIEDVDGYQELSSHDKEELHKFCTWLKLVKELEVNGEEKFSASQKAYITVYGSLDSFNPEEVEV